ncbi:DEAD-box ATP-dependent RNA helicase 39 [Acorus gramineus]|uniref:DEAD-box ATP-dependent RNA helicase 39 n=1 Tax=Acorus gramineus TaxID=55184 RepID=A0AAV9ALS7_ACOGR|nr:DEAD-box ATP-dependent RNA helicase 39 [Acorus gramineus]
MRSCSHLSAAAVAAVSTTGGGSAAGARRTLLALSIFTSKTSLSPFPVFPKTRRLFSATTTVSAATTTTTTVEADPSLVRHSLLLERLRARHLKDAASKPVQGRSPREERGTAAAAAAVSGFGDLGLTEEAMGALEEMGIARPTEIQCLGIPAVLEGKSVVLGSHTGSGKTLAYLLPLVQLMRRDEALYGMLMKPRRPRAVVLCPTRELCEQVFHVAKSVSHHARFRSIMISGGGRLRPQEDSLNAPVDMVVGTPGRVLQHIEEGNLVYGDIKYLVLDEADTMFDRGFGPDLRKFLGPLKNRASKPDDQGFQTVLVTATMTKAVQKLIDEEFKGITHLRTSTMNKKVASARHDFIKLSGSENKLESLLQVLEPSLAKGNRVMVFCNTLNSSRAVDHFLSENEISTVNYHGEVPAEERVENLKKFKSDVGDCPTLVCTDLAARGLDLDVDHVIMFDFPLNSIDYLHRTGRTARMGAKGKVTSLVARKDALLAARIEEAIGKNESLESVSIIDVKRDAIKAGRTDQKGKTATLVKSANQKTTHGRKSAQTSGRKTPATKSGKAMQLNKTRKSVAIVKPFRSSTSGPKRESLNGKKPVDRKYSGSKPTKSNSSVSKSSKSKLSVVGFRGRSSSSTREPLKSR